MGDYSSSELGDVEAIDNTACDYREGSAAAFASSDLVLSTALSVISTQKSALESLEQFFRTDRLAQISFSRAIAAISGATVNGRKVILCGVGKSGKIAQKIQATLNSFGITSVFLHPIEALHGDLGIVGPGDVVVMLTNSGRTPEILNLVPFFPSSCPIIAIVASPRSPLGGLLLARRDATGKPSGIILPAPVHESETASFGVAAPTTSTTVALVVGDALAIAAGRYVCDLNGQGKGLNEVFTSFHPGGAIGKDHAKLVEQMDCSDISQ